jgi:hypothetical protein
MTPIETIESSNFRHVTVPLEISQIKEYFENKNLFFLINYSESKIKGNMFLTYISNLDLPCEIILGSSGKQDKFELIKFYMETRNLNTSNTLKLTTAQLLLEMKGYDSMDVLRHPVLTREECAEFSSQNAELLKKWDTFISSSFLYLLTAIPELEDKYSFKSLFPVIEDPHFIGSNIVHIYSVPSFLELFFAKQATSPICYFKHQFEEYMFRGKNLFHYFDCPENTLFLLFNEILTGEKTLGDIQAMFARA